MFARQGPRRALEPNGVAIARKAVEIGTVKAGESFEAVERARFLEDFRIELECMRRGVAASTAERRFLDMPRVRRGVGSQKELRVAGSCRGDQRAPVRLALENRQTI